MTHRPPAPSAIAPAGPPTARPLREALVDELADLLGLYLASQPRSARRAVADVARSLGWSLDRRLAADLVGQLDDDVVAFLAAEAFDRAERLLGTDQGAALDLDTRDPELRERAGAQLRAALARASW